MSDHIDCYFTSASPFAFMGHTALLDMAKKHGKTVNLKPFNLMGVWGNSGAVMPAERPPVRQRYRLIELQRIADHRGIKLNHMPTHFPTNPTAADLCICALHLAGKDPSGFYHSVGQALWVEDRNIADEAVLIELLNKAGFDGESIITSSKSDTTNNLREDYTKEAIAADAIGAPAYVYSGEVFWGQDRIEFLDEMIASGRAAYKAE